METIKERADRKYNSIGRWGLFGYDRLNECYIEGATDQREIDLDEFTEKAWDWIEKACSKYPITNEGVGFMKQSFVHWMEECYDNQRQSRGIHQER